MKNPQLSERAKALIWIRVRISDPERWCQGIRGSYQDDAVCIVGAYTEYLSGHWDRYEVDVYDATRSFFGCKIDKFNDTHTHAEVLAMLDEKIAEALCEMTTIDK